MSSLPGGEHTASLDGTGNYALFDVRATDRTYFEGLTFATMSCAGSS